MDKAEKVFEISKIITRSLAGELEEGEQKRLNEWLISSEQNRKLYERLRDEASFSRHLKAYQRLDATEALEELLKEKSGREHLAWRRKLLQGFKYAAIVVLVLGISWLVYERRLSPGVPESIVPSVIPAGGSKATLTLASGEVMALSGGVASQIQTSEKILIRQDSGRLEYQLTERRRSSGEERFNQIDIPRGGEFTLVLSDGTKVWLNSESRLKFPEEFVGQQRRVYLEGEAFFEVTPDKEHQFVVVTERAAVTVYGTSFNVTDYRDDADMSVTLVSGSVGLKTAVTREQLRLVPGEQALLMGDNLSKRQVDVTDYTAWKEGRFVFTSVRLEDMLRRVARWYNIDVTFASEKSRNRAFTGEFRKYDDFNEILDIISMTNEVKICAEGQQITVY